MLANTFSQFNAQRVPSPCFVIDQAAIEANLKVLADVQQRSGAKVLAALKAFSCWPLGELTGQYLSGICASGIHEATLGKEHYGGELHTFSAGFKADELEAVLAISDHVVFNSLQQWRRHQDIIQAALQTRPQLKLGLRINPEHSEGAVEIYDPCAAGSRLGINRASLDTALKEDPSLLNGITGLHFHTLCEQGYEPLDRTLSAIEHTFGDLLQQMQWLNLGGGHHITKPDYDREALIQRIKAIRQQYSLEVYLEPGEAVAIHSGVLVTEVVDTLHNRMDIAILDTSATCHMPDVLEMPYRPDILGAAEPGVKPYTYRLGGMTCLAGDVINDYSFEAPLDIGQRLVFDDMAHYTMVKTTTFNGINLPSIALWDSRTDALTLLRTFGYEDFKGRLG